MKKETFTRRQVRAINDFNEELAKKKATDLGGIGDAFEVAIHRLLTGKRYEVKGYGLVDCITKQLTSESSKVEIKTACGGQIENTFNADFVIYCPLVNNDIEFSRQAFVFNNAQWLDFLNGYHSTKGGKLLRFNKVRNTYQIQSFYGSETVRPRASKTLANYIWEYCYNMPTLYDIFNGN